jgi:hypothetical protein
MDNKDYHFISLKFLTAILMALFFAFLLVYVFSPEIKNNYRVYNFDSQSIKNSKNLRVFDENENGKLFLDTAKKQSFESELKTRSFRIMDQSKKAVLTVLTSNNLDKINGLKGDEDLLLNELKIRLNNEGEKLLQGKRQDLEAELSEKLQNIRKKVKDNYSDYSQKEIRDNYLKIINLKIAVEVLAKDEAEKAKYRSQLQQVEQEQDKILAEKNTVLNQDIAAETRTLIMDFNREFAAYRQRLESDHQELINKREAEAEEKLAAYRQEIKSELSLKVQTKAAEMDQLIAESKEYY